MKCKNCGTEIQGQAKFCVKCGKKLEYSRVVNTSTTSSHLNNISSIWPEWQIEEKPIGKGSYGVVYKAVRRDNNVESHAAIKIISIPSDSSEVDSLRTEGLDMAGTRTYFKGIVDDFVSEIQLMESLKGVQNIVSVEDYKVVEKADTIGWDIYIRMELLTPFNTYICDKTLTEREIIKFGTDICTALEICNRRNIIHRDIKPENIFINDFGYFKLGDFGIARKLENVTGGLSQKGTFNYMAPEVAVSNEYDARVDIYSLGVVLYRLLNNNKLPFLDTDKQLLSPVERKLAVERRIRGEALPVPCNASPAMANLILRACAHNPDARFASATEMKQALISVANGTYRIVDINPKKATAVYSNETNHRYNVTERMESRVPQQSTQPMVNSFGDAPKKKKGTAVKVLVILALSMILVIALAISAVFVYSGYKDSLETMSVIQQADEYYENGDYESAILEYAKVPESSKNYEEAQEKLNQVYSEYISFTVKTAKELNSSKNYKQAIQVINTAYTVLPDDVNTSELDTIKEEIFSYYKTDIATEVTELIENEKWSEAFELIDEAISFDDNEYFHHLKASTEDLYIKSVSDTVQEYLDNEDYISAKRVVDNSLTVLPEKSDLKSLQSKVEKATPTYLLDVCKPYSTGSTYKEYVNGETVKMGGVSYTNAFGYSDTSYAIFNLSGKYNQISFVVGHEDGTKMSDTIFKVYCDDILMTEIEIDCEALPQKVTLDITGVQQIKFTSTEAYGSPRCALGNVTVK